MVFELYAGEVGDGAGVGAFGVFDFRLDIIVLDVGVDEDVGGF